MPSIVAVCYCDLGRGGAERSECPPVLPHRDKDRGSSWVESEVAWYAHGGGGARMRIWGEGVCSDVARRVAIKNHRVAIMGAVS